MIDNSHRQSLIDPVAPPNPFRFSEKTFPKLISDSQKQQERIEHLTKENHNMKKLLKELQTQQTKTSQNTTKQHNHNHIEQTITHTVTEQLRNSDIIRQTVDKSTNQLKSELCQAREHILNLENRLAECTESFKKQMLALQTEIMRTCKPVNKNPPSSDTPVTRSRNLKRRFTHIKSPTSPLDSSRTSKGKKSPGDTTNSE